MVKTLSKHGNSCALVLDRELMELLGIEGGTPLELRTDGRSLIVTPAPESDRDQRFDEALARINEDHADMLRRLAE